MQKITRHVLQAFDTAEAGQARLHLFVMFTWHRKHSIKEPSPVSVALMGFQQTWPENKTSPVLTSCFSNDQRRMSSQRFDPGWGNCKRTPPKPQCPATSQGCSVKLKPPDHRLIQVCLILTRLTKGIRRECEMKDVFGCILRQACDQWGDTDRGMTRINSLKCSSVRISIYVLYWSHGRFVWFICFGLRRTDVLGMVCS